MRWDEGHESPDVIDRRGQGGGGGAGGLGMLALLPLLGRSRWGWLVLLIVLVGSGVGIFGGGGTSEEHASLTQTTGAAAQKTPDQKAHFVAFVLDDTQATWRALLGSRYQNAKLVMFTDSTPTACGYGQTATGPFYCPLDKRVYIDLSFYNELENKLGAKGDFAQAYVIAHEIGHHVQNLLGSQAMQKKTNAESVRLELQADCYAGIWARSTQNRGVLEPGDMDEALNAASAIGDDRLQRNSGGSVHPETFTHGTSAQRSRWLKRGYDAGTIDACDTFSNPE